jgi:hypothetical protein
MGALKEEKRYINTPKDIKIGGDKHKKSGRKDGRGI